MSAHTLADPANRRRIAALGSSLVCERYGWDAIVPTLIGHYKEAIAACREGRL